MKCLVFIPFLALACSGKSDTAEPDGDTHTIWAGWNHQWGLLSHRVSLIRVKAGEDGSAESGILGGDWSTGESWSDDVNTRIHQQAVTADGLEVTTGEVSITVGPDGEASVPVPDAVGDLVVLQGFEIDTDLPLIVDPGTDAPDYDPRLGFTSRGFGMALSEGESGWQATATVRWGPRDRADMNAAIPLAQTAVTIYWAAITGITETTPVVISGSQPLPHSPPNSPQVGHSEALGLTGHGFAAIRGFSLGVDDTDGGDGGDYLRSFGVELPPGPTGEPPATISAEVLTTSVIELGEMSMTYDVEATWVELDPNSSRVEGETVAGKHQIGRHIIPIE